MRSEFLFNGVSRLSYGWQNPNFAAAVLVCLLPFVWVATDRVASRLGHRVYWLWLTEVALGLMVVWTYSRGGILAWLLAAIFYGWACPRQIDLPGDTSMARGHLFLRLTILVVAVVCNGVTQRFTGIAEGDPSAAHRLELWRGGLAMLSHHPASGWGGGVSGFNFMQWFQRPESTFGMGTMINSYLHLAVEYGLPALAGLLVLFLTPLFIGWRVARASSGFHRELICGAMAGLVAFLVSAIFSTFWNAGSVMWAPVLLVAVFVATSLGSWRGGRPRKEGVVRESGVRGQESVGEKAVDPKPSDLNHEWTRMDVDPEEPRVRVQESVGDEPRILPQIVGRAILAAAGVSAVICVAMFIVGLVFSAQGAWSFREEADGAVTFSNRVAGGTTDLVFLADSRTLGGYYGRELRRIAGEDGAGIREFTVFPPEVAPPAGLTGTVLAFGPRYRDLRALGPSARLVVVCPSGSPSALPAAVVPALLILPDVDEIGYDGAWRNWAAAKGCPVTVLAGAGQEIQVQAAPMLAAILATP